MAKQKFKPGDVVFVAQSDFYDNTYFGKVGTFEYLDKLEERAEQYAFVYFEDVKSPKKFVSLPVMSLEKYKPPK